MIRSDAPESHIGVAKRLNKEIANSVILDQYANPNNPLAHYEGTAEEILSQMDHRIDMLVVAAGTGGTLAGIARKIKERIPTCKVVGVDPHGSILAQPESLNKEGIHSYKVEGIGYDFVPKVLDHSLVDKWVKTDDRESFLMARKLIRVEGLLCGGSSGSAVSGALQAARDLPAGSRVVVILPDSIRNYMSKFLSDDWMRANDFAPETQTVGSTRSWRDGKVSDLPLPKVVSVDSTMRCEHLVRLFESKHIDYLPVLDPSSKLVGMITMRDLTRGLADGKLTSSSTAADAVKLSAQDQHQIVSPSTSLSALYEIFEKKSIALVSAGDAGLTKIERVATQIDLVSYMAKHSLNCKC